MRVAVTGASGFIGRNFLLSCPKSWKIDAYYRSAPDFPVFVRKNCPGARAIRRDFSDEQDARRIGKRTYDICLYLAGNTDPQLSFSEPAFDLKANALGLVNFLSKARIKKLIYFSSGAVYHGLRGPVNPRTKLDPRLPYAISKLASEGYVKSFKERGSVGEYAIVRFFGAYGPYEPKRKITTKLVERLAVQGRRDFEIYGDGKNLIDLMYVSDAVEAIHTLIKLKKTDFTADLANRDPVSIGEFVRASASALGAGDVRISKRGVSHESIGFRSNDCTMRRMGFRPKVSPELGIRLLAEHLSRC